MKFLFGPVILVVSMIGSAFFSILEWTITFLLVPIPIVLFLWVLFNASGVLIGFERNSDFCRAYLNHTQSRLEKTVIAAPIACSKQGGLLMPAIYRTYTWLVEREIKGEIKRNVYGP